MATLYKKRDMWYVDYYVEGKRFSKNTYLKSSIANKKEADKIKRKIEDLISSKKYIMSTGKSLIAYVDVFKREHLSLKSKSHQGVFEDALAHFIKIVPKETKIEDINSEHVARFIEKLKPKVANSTLLTYISYMKIFFNFLVEEDIIPRNPIRKKQIPKRIKKNIVFFSENMLDEILNTAKDRDPEYYKFLKMLLLTGQRPIDVLGLTVGNVDRENELMYLNISKTGKQIIFPIYDQLKDFFEDELTQINNSPKEERIFKNFNSNIVEKRFQRIKRYLKITEKNVYTLKTFRKTFASYLAAKGVDQAKIADLLGHDDPKTTRKYYAAISAINLRKELNNLPKDDNAKNIADKIADNYKK
ncbi:MAG: tyrosine-type recombinase/integrase [Ignavibacteriae bacterium]|nr:tyrosine-type recombinase/integrase [Ignavibacteriota bacterium]